MSPLNDMSTLTDELRRRAMRDTLNVVKLAYDHISDPRNWSATGVVSERHEGRRCAMQWFDWARAGLMPNQFDQWRIDDIAHDIFDELSMSEFGCWDFIEVNDGHGHWAVCRIYRMTIARLEGMTAAL